MLLTTGTERFKAGLEAQCLLPMGSHCRCAGVTSIVHVPNSKHSSGTQHIWVFTIDVAEVRAATASPGRREPQRLCRWLDSLNSKEIASSQSLQVIFKVEAPEEATADRQCCKYCSAPRLEHLHRPTDFSSSSFGSPYIEAEERYSQALAQEQANPFCAVIQLQVNHWCRRQR